MEVMDIQTFIETYAVARKGSDCLKWDALQERFGAEDLLPLWVADMDFKAPPAVEKALIQRVRQGAFGYSQNLPDYFSAFAAWQKKRHGITLESNWLRFSKGVVESIYHLIQIFTAPGDGVLIQPPVYYPFFNAVRETGRKLVENQLVQSADGSWQVDLAAFEKQLATGNVRLFLLCSPHNPVGRIWREAELQALFALCEKYDVLILADEIHQDFDFSEAGFVSALQVAEGHFQERLVVVNAPSKTFNLASLLHGHILIPNHELRECFDQKIKPLSQSENNLLGQIAGAAAYRDGGDWFDAVKQVIWENYRYLRDYLVKTTPKIQVSQLEGSYLVWLDLSGLGLTDAQTVEKFIKEDCQLAVDFGSWFSAESSSFIRLNLACSPAVIKQACDRLATGVLKRQLSAEKQIK